MVDKNSIPWNCQKCKKVDQMLDIGLERNVLRKEVEKLKMRIKELEKKEELEQVGISVI